MGETKTRMLWHSNAGWSPTGYGQQTGLFAPRLAEHYDIGISAFYGLEGARLNWNGIITYPGMQPDMGNKTLLPHAKAHFEGDVRSGLVITLLDVWVLDPAVARKLNMACWVPVDHEPAPPRVLEFFRDSGAIPIAMSKFGARMLEEFDPLYVPHGIDTDAYKPIDQKKARELTQLPQDKWLVGMVAANKGNPSRKCFAEAFMAFKRFHDLNPDAALYLHTEAQGMFNGVDLPALLREVGIPGEAVYLADQERLLFNPVGHETMGHVYSALDVLLSPSAGEGFGIPVLEANACGVPAIVTDFSAQAEVCGSGYKVGWEPYWTTQSSWQAHPHVADIVDALKACHRRTDREVEQMAKQARDHALEYDVDHVMEHQMLPALAEVERRYAAKEPKLVAA